MRNLNISVLAFVLWLVLSPPTFAQSTDPVFVSGEIIYPARAEIRGLEGWVDTLLTITSSGSVASCSILASSSSLFEPAACASALSFTFVPAMLDGVPVQVDYEYRVIFELGSPTRFGDVDADHWAYSQIEALANSGISSGCGSGNYCPDDPVTRAQMAVFLERGMRGSDYVPPPASGNVFLDVAASDFAANFIEQLYLDGVTGGCGNNNYCPSGVVTRAQMAIFLLRAKFGSGHVPPPPSGLFDDVDLAHWAVSWIEQLASEGITSGCGQNNYCPDTPVTRAQMAVFLVRTFGLL